MAWLNYSYGIHPRVDSTVRTGRIRFLPYAASIPSRDSFLGERPRGFLRRRRDGAAHNRGNPGRHRRSDSRGANGLRCRTDQWRTFHRSRLWYSCHCITIGRRKCKKCPRTRRETEISHGRIRLRSNLFRKVRHLDSRGLHPSMSRYSEAVRSHCRLRRRLGILEWMSG